jgi:cell shape-determining protein MreC
MNSLKVKAKTKGQLAFDMISYLLTLQNTPKKWTKKKEEEFRNESQEKWVRLEDAEQLEHKLSELKQKLQQLLKEFPSKDGGSQANWRVNMYSTREVDEWKKKFEELLKEKEAKPT